MGRMKHRTAPGAGRGGELRAGRRRQGGGGSGPPSADASGKLSWTEGIDTIAPLPRDALLRAYRVAPCKALASAHRKRDCRSTPLCVAPLRTQKINAQGQRELCEAVLGLPPDEMTKEPPRSLRRGLRNISNTCYLNAVVQLLFHIPEVREAVLRVGAQLLDGGHSTNELLATRFYDLFADLAASYRAVVDPKPFVTAMEIDPGVQQDAHEFFALLTHCLGQWHLTIRDALAGALSGTVLYERTCRACGGVSKKADPVSSFSLQVRETLGESLTLALSEEIDGFMCERCGATGTATVQMTLRQPPKYLLIHLLRFKYNDKFEKVKVPDATSLPARLDVRALSHGKQEQGPAAATEFELVAVVNHLGASANCGHYVLSQRLDDDGEWYLFDDACVSVPSKHQQRRNTAADGALVSRDAYMVLYRSVEPSDAEVQQVPAEAGGDLTAFLHPSARRRLADERERHAESATSYLLQRESLEADFKRWSALAQLVFKQLEHLPPPEVPLYAVPRQWLRFLGAAGPCSPSNPIVKKEDGSDADDSDGPEGEYMRFPNNATLLCPHKKLAPTASFKLLPEETFTELNAQHPVVPVLTTERDLCTECGAAEISRLQRLHNDAKEEAAMRQMAAVECTAASGHLVSKAVLQAWIDRAAVPDGGEGIGDLGHGLVCEHGNLRVDAATQSVTEDVFLYLTSKKSALCTARFASGTPKCGTCISAHCLAAATAHDLKLQRAGEMKRLRSLAAEVPNQGRFRDIAKRTKTHRAKWLREHQQQRAVAAAAEAAEAAADAAVSVRPASKRGRAPAAGAPAPAGASPTVIDVDQEANTGVTRGPTPPASDADGCPPLRVELPLVSADWARQWRAWARGADDATRPAAAPSNAAHICPHGNALYAAEELHPDHGRDVGQQPPLIIVDPDELAAIEELYEASPSPRMCFVELNERRVLDPPTCEVCQAERVRIAAEERVHFTNGCILVEGRVKQGRRGFADVSAAIDGVSASTPLAVLRLRLYEHVLLQHQLLVPANDFVLQRGKSALPLPEGTLFDNGVLVGMTLRFQQVTGTAVDAQSQHLLASAMPSADAVHGAGHASGTADSASAPEANFAQSRLVATASSGPSPGTKSRRPEGESGAPLKECGTCTFLNAPSRSVCEMCETPLL